MCRTSRLPSERSPHRARMRAFPRKQAISEESNYFSDGPMYERSTMHLPYRDLFSLWDSFHTAHHETPPVHISAPFSSRPVCRPSHRLRHNVLLGRANSHATVNLQPLRSALWHRPTRTDGNSGRYANQYRRDQRHAHSDELRARRSVRFSRDDYAACAFRGTEHRP